MNRVQRLAEGLWTIPFPFSMSGIQLGTRTTIVNTARGLVLISPGPFDDQTLDEVRSLGEVAGLVAPNLMHHLFMDKAQNWFPEARVWLAPGLDKKRPDLRYDELLGTQPAQLWSEQLEQIQVLGMPRLHETVFFHKASRTLILTDLAFNFHRCSHWPTRLVLSFNGALGRFGPSRLLRYFFLSQEGPFRESLAQILKWPFERVVVAHGEVLEAGGRQALQHGYAWLGLNNDCSRPASVTPG